MALTAGLEETAPVWLSAGTRVDVRNRFDSAWATGFEIVESGPNGYRLLRLRDRCVLPFVFRHADVRTAL